LLVERDAAVLARLQVGLEQAGWAVAPAHDAAQALALLAERPPDVLITAADLPSSEGYGLVRKLRERADVDVPVILITAGPEDRIRGLELGVEELVTRPVAVAELVACVRLVLDRQIRRGLRRGEAVAGAFVEGEVFDLIAAAIEGRVSGTLRLSYGNRRGDVALIEGRPVDAVQRHLRGEEAALRMMTWPSGRFSFEPEMPGGEVVIELTGPDLLEAGVRHVSEFQKLAAELPPLGTLLTVDRAAMGRRAAEIPHELDGVLALLDEGRTVFDLLDESPFDDLSTLATLAKLHAERLLVVGGPLATAAPAGPVSSRGRRRSAPALAHVVDGLAVTPTPAPVASERSDPPPGTSPAATARGVGPTERRVDAGGDGAARARGDGGAEKHEAALADTVRTSSAPRPAPGDPAATPRSEPPRSDPRPTGGSPRSSSTLRAPSSASPRSLSESGVSDAFLASDPPPEPSAEESPVFSDHEPVYLTEEQLARKRKSKRLVAGVIALLALAVAGVFVARRLGAGAPSARPAPQPPATVPVAAPATGLADTDATPTVAPPPPPPEIPSATPSAAPSAGAAEAGDEQLPDVDDPLKETARLINASKWKEAIPMAKAAIRKDPENGDAYIYLGAAYQSLGDRKAELATYDECVRRATKGQKHFCASLGGKVDRPP
jgi:CheY-like chemotaxis protein